VEVAAPARDVHCEPEPRRGQRADADHDVAEQRLSLVDVTRLECETGRVGLEAAALPGGTADPVPAAFVEQLGGRAEVAFPLRDAGEALRVAGAGERVEAGELRGALHALEHLAGLFGVAPQRSG